MPWVLIVLAAALLVSCAQPTQREAAPCTITVQPGESLQAAIDRAPAGAVICLPAGAWTESIQVTKPLSLRGAGSTRTKVRGGALGQPVIRICSPDGPVSLTGIAFGGAGGAGGLLVEGEADVRIVRCVVAENSGSGVAVYGSARVVIEDTAITGNAGRGLEAEGQTRVFLNGTSVSSNRQAGLWVAGSAYLEIVRSTVSKSEGPGIWVREEGRLIATDSAITQGESHGIWVRDRAVAEITGGTISAHARAGVWSEHSSQLRLTSTVIERNWEGIELRDSARAKIVDCTILGSRWDGVALGGASWAEVLGCVISGGRGSGINLAGSAQARVSHNRIDSWTAHGILSLSRVQPWGEGNRMWGNGVDLAGNLPSSLRAPLVPPSEEEVRFPNRNHATVQEAADALLPGGRLVLREGIYAGGITIEKPLRIEADGIVLLTARSNGGSPVLSLIGGADLVMSGVALGYGSEGLVLGANAQAALTDCVLSDNGRGIHAAGESWIALLRCRLSRNEQGGMWLWDQASADVHGCAFTANGVCGIGVGGAAGVAIEDCLLTENGWNGGIVLRDAATGRIERNTIVRNYGAGVALYHGLCIGGRYVFRGQVTGGGNVFSDNYKGDVCPAALGFLREGSGELDLRH